jgi:hypothetical protein
MAATKPTYALTFVILTAVRVEDIAFSDLAPCSLVVGYKRFRGTCWRHLQSEMEEIATSKAFVLSY